MITIPRYLDRTSEPVVRLIGLGNAGVNLADRITIGEGTPIQTVAMNSDFQSLSSSVAGTKVALGPLSTRGLGAGGDPEIGLDAARESSAEIDQAVAGADIIFLCAGLGGGTGSGAAGFVAEAGRRAGALLIAIVTSPFAFEGRRRSAQARAALAEIESHADAVIHFENDRMAELTAPRAGVSETFAACDDLLGGCVFSLVGLMGSTGPLSVGLPDILTVLRSGSEGCLFGTGASAGGNRAHEALEQALRSPLLDRGRLLDRASNLLVHVGGPSKVEFVELTAVLEHLAKHVSDMCRVHLGVSVSESPSGPVTVTLIGQCGTPEQTSAPAPAVAPAVRSAPVAPAAEPRPPTKTRREPVAEPEPELLAPVAPRRDPEPEPVVRSVEPPPRPLRPAPVPAPTAAAPAKPKIKQETLQFEPVARGRFEKIEPTIVEGEDLDVPTFLRRKVPKP